MCVSSWTIVPRIEDHGKNESLSSADRSRIRIEAPLLTFIPKRPASLGKNSFNTFTLQLFFIMTGAQTNLSRSSNFFAPSGFFIFVKVFVSKTVFGCDIFGDNYVTI
jgi:hypothetical protein